MTLHIFGIRHHGPGSAHSLHQALVSLQPDIILIEGPPEAEPLLPLVISPAMQPPVALLIYTPDSPQNCVYYPFAIFSPEWQALNYGVKNSIPVRFMDLPLTHRLAIAKDKENSPPSLLSPSFSTADPLSAIAEAAGYSDGESWWEHLVETRGENVDLFAAILEVMTALRQELPAREDPIEAQREAYMRKIIREAQNTGFQRIAVICGAWHTPALSTMPSVKEDTAILKGLPKIKIEATWVPWTYGRLSYNSGYGAGVQSPGWYHYLWEYRTESRRPTESSLQFPHHPHSLITIRWMTQVAQLLREQNLDASSAHVIEAVRLAETLAALRDRSIAGLPELNEATQTVLCFGSDLPMQLIHNKLIIGERLGNVPPETPMVPLQQDLFKQQKRLRIPPEASVKTLDLDLRKENDLARSHLLHRLNLLDIPWGKLQQAGNKKGTFHEYWQLQWHPEFAVNLIEASIWGNTIKEAAKDKACTIADEAEDLPTLTTLLNQVILSDLSDAVVYLMSRLEEKAALASDVTYLMAALPPLANVMRYGNVRQTDTAMISHVVDGLVARICINLPPACASLDDDAAGAMYENLIKVNGAIALLKNQEYTIAWQQVLTLMAENQSLHGLVAGRCCRLLLDGGVFDAVHAGQKMSLALSKSNEPPQAAAWVEGFLRGSGLLILHDDQLWQVLDNWITELSEENFITLLPLLRRTFATFTPPERRQMGEKVKRGVKVATSNSANFEQINEENAVTVLPIIAQLLGIT